MMDLLKKSVRKPDFMVFFSTPLSSDKCCFGKDGNKLWASKNICAVMKAYQLQLLGNNSHVQILAGLHEIPSIKSIKAWDARKGVALKCHACFNCCVEGKSCEEKLFTVKHEKEEATAVAKSAPRLHCKLLLLVPSVLLPLIHSAVLHGNGDLHLHFHIEALLVAGVLFLVLVSCWSVCWCEDNLFLRFPASLTQAHSGRLSEIVGDKQHCVIWAESTGRLYKQNEGKWLPLPLLSSSFSCPTLGMLLAVGDPSGFNVGSGILRTYNPGAKADNRRTCSWCIFHWSACFSVCDSKSECCVRWEAEKISSITELSAEPAAEGRLKPCNQQIFLVLHQGDEKHLEREDVQVVREEKGPGENGRKAEGGLGADDGLRCFEGKTEDVAAHVHLTMLVQAGCNEDLCFRNESDNPWSDQSRGIKCPVLESKRGDVKLQPVKQKRDNRSRCKSLSPGGRQEYLKGNGVYYLRKLNFFSNQPLAVSSYISLVKEHFIFY
ncbi:hypothetical protein EK904_005321 [Melospiza melodia maxima]|nr:hypothetical protein EK904_005321 [Melospiza melodia maxima]